MKHTKPEKSRVIALRKGTLKQLGLLEKLPLIIAGYRDGKSGLPRRNESKEWVSPHIEKELRSYDEYCSSLWCKLQFQQETSFARLEELVKSLSSLYAQIESADLALSRAVDNEKTVTLCRKQGEADLCDSQVADRRAAERKARLLPLESKLATLRERVASETNEFAALRAKILEENNSARMVCNRMRDHLYQRLAVYWAAALRQRKNDADYTSMPTVPSVERAFHSEAVYMEPHRQLLSQADRLYDALKNESEEAV